MVQLHYSNLSSICLKFWKGQGHILKAHTTNFSDWAWLEDELWANTQIGQKIGKMGWWYQKLTPTWPSRFPVPLAYFSLNESKCRGWFFPHFSPQPKLSCSIETKIPNIFMYTNWVSLAKYKIKNLRIESHIRGCVKSLEKMTTNMSDKWKLFKLVSVASFKKTTVTRSSILWPSKFQFHSTICQSWWCHTQKVSLTNRIKTQKTKKAVFTTPLWPTILTPR